jgi:thiol:disulfide interchange protein DsbC
MQCSLNKAIMRNMRIYKTGTLILLLLSLLTGVAAADTSHEQVMDGIRASLLAARPGIPITAIKPTVAEGIYEVQIAGGTILHADKSGRYFFASDLFVLEADGIVNFTEASRSVQRKELLEGLDESEMLVFAPAPDRIKTTVTVFTDIDCGYCRKLHQEVPELNRLGIAVRYLAYPRAGLDSESYDKAVSAWCADNPRIALTQAKSGVDIEKRECANPVASHMDLGAAFGVNGTPAVFYEDGTLQNGYMPAEDMAARLGVIEPRPVDQPGS